MGSQDFHLSIVLGAEYLSDVKSIATFALTFFGYIISVLQPVWLILCLSNSITTEPSFFNTLNTFLSGINCIGTSQILILQNLSL